MKIKHPCSHCYDLYSQGNPEFASLNIECSKNMEYYPHPLCLHYFSHNHIATEEPDIQVHLFSPLDSFYTKASLPGLPYISISTSNVLQGFIDNQLIVGRGIDFDLKKAKLKAKMEAIERICTYLPARAELQWASQKEISHSLINFHTINPNQARWWMKPSQYYPSTSKSIKNCSYFLPLEFSQLGSRCTVTSPLICADSTGIAVHSKFENALFNGIAEIIERAATQNFWETLDAKRINIDSLENESKSMINSIMASGYELIVLDISGTYPLYVYAVLLIAEESNEGPALVCGAGASNNSSIAVRHALLEAYAQLMHAIEIWPKDPDGKNQHYDTFLLYLQSAQAKKALSYIAPVRDKLFKFQKLEKSFDDILKNLKRVFYVDRGNALTDYLKIFAIQAFLPDLPPQHRQEKAMPNKPVSPF
ncbi:MAG: hypothetical protein K0R66_1177 [Gammaproteobacteria bacterium]|jgi:thiazole/oxazole-forming peptide maturase SagD family component|nr:hypothetical protein [Gammaproteobacteria bacterium]